MKAKKNFKIFALTLLTSLLLLSISPVMFSVKAQTQATVTILDSIGGTTDPTADTHTYNDGTAVTLTGTPTAITFSFTNWIITSSEGSSVVATNPYTLTVTGGVTYTIQATFTPTQAPPGGGALPANMATAAIVVVLAAAGGTTNPPPGTYALAEATNLNLTATPDSGWQFSHWVISGEPQSHGGYSFDNTPTDNPYNVNHGYGNTYSYQPVFVLTGSTEPGAATPTPGSTIAGMSLETVAIIGLVVVIIVILIAFGVYAARRRK